MDIFFTCMVLFISATIVDSMNNFADIPCGRRASEREMRVVGGTDAIPHEFPWTASIMRHGDHFCGAVIVTRKHILTAAHCVCAGIGEDLAPAGSIRIGVGQHNIKDKGNVYEATVDSIFVNPGYSCKRSQHDLAVLVLATQLKWSEKVKPACLPSGNTESDYSNFVDVQAIAAGWGWLGEDKSNDKATLLQKAKVNIIENETCEKWYQSQRKKGKIQIGQMCAGYKHGGIDACWADSGGPLMVTDNENMMVVGIISTGKGCARPYLPGIYTRISEYIPWIRSIIH